YVDRAERPYEGRDLQSRNGRFEPESERLKVTGLILIGNVPVRIRQQSRTLLLRSCLGLLHRLIGNLNSRAAFGRTRDLYRSAKCKCQGFSRSGCGAAKHTQHKADQPVMAPAP